MKKIECTLLIILAFLTANSYGDIIFTEYPQAKIRVRITNLSDFPDIVLVGCSDCMAVSKSKRAYVVQPDSCLEVHKACPLTIYAVKKDYFEKKNLKKIKWEKDQHVISSNLTVSAKTFDTTSLPIHTVELDFNIAGFNDSIMILYQTKRVNKFNDGRNTVRHFDYEGDLSKLRKNFD
ncbi:MAG: hypothetical protein LBQ60_07690 [Bacteroidales bacterium]|jgi:hypothetical protein|nr:hypothetical protein [Bacteroidales bacterium]